MKNKFNIGDVVTIDVDKIKSTRNIIEYGFGMMDYIENNHHSLQINEVRSGLRLGIDKYVYFFDEISNGIYQDVLVLVSELRDDKINYILSANT